MSRRFYYPAKKLFFLVGMAVILMHFSGCSSTTISEDKPLPDMTFEHIKPLPLNVAAIDIITTYDPDAEEEDVSISFPVPPDIAVRRYAGKRLEANGQSGVLKFIISDARVHYKVVEPENKVWGWSRLNARDRYEVLLELMLYTEDINMQQSAHSVLKLRRAISIPQSYSLARKEREQFTFLEMLMQDVDKAVTRTLTKSMGLGIIEDRAATTSREVYEENINTDF